MYIIAFVHQCLIITPIVFMYFSCPSRQNARRSKQIRAHVQTGQGEKVADDAAATDGRADVARRRGHIGRGQQSPPIRHVGR